MMNESAKGDDASNTSSSSSNVESARHSESAHKTGCCAKLKHGYEQVQLEPVLFIQNLVSQMVYVTSQDLMVEKACRVNHDLTPTVCNDLNSYDYTDEVIHDQVSEFLMWRNIFETAIKFAVVLFMGPWSDRVGRRGPLMLCLLMLMGESGLMLVNSFCPQWPLEMMLLCSVPYALSGGTYGLLMLAFAHTADTTGRKRRTFRMGYLDTFWYFGQSIGLAVTPLVKDVAGYAGVFGSAIVLYILAAAYVFFRLRNESPNKMEITQGSQGKCCVACETEYISLSVSAVMRKRPDNARSLILVLILIMMLDSLASSGAMNVRYLFVLRAVDWTSAQYSYWSSGTSFLSVVGGFVLVPLVTLVCTLPDQLVGVAGSVSRMAASLSYATINSASEAWLLYLGSVVGCFSVLAPVAVRSCLSKLAPADIGSVFAVMAACESLVPFLSAPIYRALYNATNTLHPGYYNFFSTGVYLVMILLFGWLLKSVDLARPET
ncbi:proton-coupled folate transporter [Hyalella azteca]|uniref:Proton-coupled folate transporter n=1 Tax=Hyalella azteca TaxID=294128 RepID=A0A8B7NEM8_HYAAZ|nr:proton-coupled folate transporter [Hyalella azteca]